jgi:nitrous-oxide reductase
MSEKEARMAGEDKRKNWSRRDMLGTTAAVAAAGAAGVAGGVKLSETGVVTSAEAQTRPASPAVRPAVENRYEVKPGELDEYYVFFSSGQTGEVRIVGLPSMRELMRVPVFNRDSATGWGQTNESIKILTEGLTPENREFLKDKGGIYTNGDLHHPHPSFTDGTYDGRYLFANDKSNTRVCRIRLDIMKCDKIIQLPNQSTVHGLRVQKYPKTGYVFCNGEDRVPVPNDGKVLDEPKKYSSLFTAVDGETMKVAWQIMVDGNLDNVDADYQGKYAWSTCYNSEEGVTLAEMMAKEQDWVVVFNLKRIEEDVKAGKHETIGGPQRSPWLALHPLHSRREQPAWNQHGAGRHSFRCQRQAFADRDRVRRAQARRPVRRQDPAARHRGGRAGARPRAAAHRL